MKLDEATLQDLIKALHDSVIDGDGLSLSTVSELSDEELDEAYNEAWFVWSAVSKKATDTLKELTPGVPWQDRMAISQAYSHACFWNVIVCQLGLVQGQRKDWKLLPDRL